MKVFSTFSGIGGFDLALERCGQKIIGHSEIDKYADQIYSNHFNNKNYGDITKIEANDLPQFDLLCGGFPCQAFSIAGKREGFGDERGTLFFEIIRIIREKQPRLLLLENVEGLLSHNQGNSFYTIISTLDELGYDLQWQVLNSKNFGVPQNRERVFIVGHLRGTSRPEIFPIGETGKKDTRNVGEDLSYYIDSNYHKGTNTLSKGRRQLIEKNKPFIFSKPHGFNKGGKREYPNMRVSSIQNEFVNGVRRLTPKECERLQGFPDLFTEKGIDQNGNDVFISDSQRYKCLGNAVTVNVVEAILKKLLQNK